MPCREMRSEGRQGLMLLLLLRSLLTRLVIDRSIEKEIGAMFQVGIDLGAPHASTSALKSSQTSWETAIGGGMCRCFVVSLYVMRLCFLFAFDTEMFISPRWENFELRGN